MKSMKWLLGAALMLPALALAGRLGVVQFANGSTTPTKIPAALVPARPCYPRPCTGNHGAHGVLCKRRESPIMGRADCHIDHASEGHEIHPHQLRATGLVALIFVTDAWSKTSDQWKSISQ